MGIVINQSFKNMVTTYLGFGIGAINTLFLFTYFLDREHYGLVSYLLSASNLIWPFMVFGVHFFEENMANSGWYFFPMLGGVSFWRDSSA